MTEIYGALLLLAAYFATALATMFLSHDFGHLLFSKYCEASALLSAPCQAAAMRVAGEGLATVAAVAVVTLGFARKSRRNGVVSPCIGPFDASFALMTIFLAAIVVVLATHYAHHEPGGYHAAEAVYISIESLSWPLLLQLTAWSQQIRWKCVLAIFLVAIVLISPFRNTFFSMVYFGVLVPFFTMRHTDGPWSRRRVVRVLATTILVLLIPTMVFYQTYLRAIRNTAESPHGYIATIEQSLAFRAFVPFFGAVFLDNVARSQLPLPSFLATIERKFGLVKSDLNEYAYQLLYGWDDISQETPLYYGESLANTGVPPIFWEFAAPLALSLAYFYLRPLCDVSLLVAVALWRGSMGGFFDVFTALVFQVGFCVVLSFLRGKPRGHSEIRTEQHEVA